MSTSLLSPTFVLVLLLLAGCAASRSNTDTQEPQSIDNVDDLLTHLGQQGYVLRSTNLVFPFALADVGYEYRVQGGRIRIYEFESRQVAEHAVNEFLIDSFGGRNVSVFQHGRLMVAYAGESSALQLTLANSLGPAIF